MHVILVPIATVEPCAPSPCGPYSICRVVGERAVCSCQSDYIGAPPQCRPECISTSDCQLDRSCINKRCIDPCPGTCGNNALCRVVGHSPICSCRTGFTGDPFVQCVTAERKHLLTTNRYSEYVVNCLWYYSTSSDC